MDLSPSLVIRVGSGVRREKQLKWKRKSLSVSISWFSLRRGSRLVFANRHLLQPSLCSLSLYHIDSTGFSYSQQETNSLEGNWLDVFVVIWQFRGGQKFSCRLGKMDLITMWPEDHSSLGPSCHRG